jgi:CubicO group peptidase (beta-lactamase class C family)
VYLDELGELVRSLCTRFAVPGAAVGVIDGESEAIVCCGDTSVEEPRPVGPRTLFQIGSITRTVTALMTMRLVEAGRLDLEVPIRRYLPEFQLADEDVASRINLRHLFTHRGGWWREHLPDTGEGDDALALAVAALATARQLVPLESVYYYLPSGTSVAGRVIEKVLGRTYEEACRELVLEPLGLSDACFTATEAITRSFAVGHHLVDGRPAVARPWDGPRCYRPGSGLIVSLADTMTHARFQLGDGSIGGRTVLSERALRFMQSPIAAAPFGEHVGLAWFLRDSPAGRFIRHAGGADGHACWIQCLPSRRFAVVILANVSNTPFIYELMRWLLSRRFGLEQPRAERWLARAAGPAEQMRPFLGHYDMPKARLELVRRHDSLVALVTLKPLPGATEPAPDLPPMRLAFTGLDRVIVIDQPWYDMPGEFVRGPDGRVAWFHLGGKTFAFAGVAPPVPLSDSEAAI